MTLLVQPELVALFRGQFEGVDVVDSVEQVRSAECWARNYSLPHLLGVRGPHDVSGAPYLMARGTFRPLRGDLRIGLVWAGSVEHSNDAIRSTRLADWAPVLQVPGVALYSLQVGPPRGNSLTRAPTPSRISAPT